MIKTLNKIYHANDLKGELLVRPFKQVHHYFNSKTDLLSRIAHVAAALFVYPLFALLAGLGMVVKGAQLLLYPNEIKKHNEARIAHLMLNRFSLIHHPNDFSTRSEDSLYSKDDAYMTQDTFLMTSENVNPIFDTLVGKIRNYTQEFKKVYLVQETNGPTIRIELKTLEPIYT